MAVRTEKEEVLVKRYGLVGEAEEEIKIFLLLVKLHGDYSPLADDEFCTSLSYAEENHSVAFEAFGRWQDKLLRGR